jgi:hypothetical protein
VHRGVLRALELVDRLVEVHLVGRLALDGADHVAGAQADLRGGGAVDRRDHGQLAVAHRDDDPEAVEARLLALAHAAVGARRQEAGVRVERAQHALDRGVDQILVGDLGPVALLGDGHQLGVETQRLAGVVSQRLEAGAEERSR